MGRSTSYYDDEYADVNYDYTDRTFTPAETYVPSDDVDSYGSYEIDPYDEDNYGDGNGPRRPGGVSTINLADLPWKVILIVSAVVLAIVLCVVFRRQITEFFMMLLQWLVIAFLVFIAIALFFRWLFPPRRR